VNNWTAEGGNWSVSGQAGNPSPAAKFSWDPVQSDYSFSLESYPLCANGMTEGHIWLDFDVKLETFFTTGDEFLFAEVWNWEDQAWVTAASHSNQHGGFGWQGEHLDISQIAMDNIFKVRFRAAGANSLHIVGWYVDNIHIYRTCLAPSDLQAIANPNEEGIDLFWVVPEDGTVIRELVGVNIFRSKDGGGYEWIDFSTNMPYLDAPLENALYCYKVSAVWVSPTDSCESSFSNEACEVMNVGVAGASVSEANVSLSPNPATDRIIISSNCEIRELCIYDALGHLHAKNRVNDNRFEVNTSGYPASLYLARIETACGITALPFTISR
jgi:hypothetical protein